MRNFSKKRLLIVGTAVTSIGAAAALIAGATLGFFSSAGIGSGNNVFTAGTVIVGLDPAGTQVNCTIGPMSPGDTQAKTGNVACKYIVKYTGNVNAFLALDLAITGASGSAIEIPHTAVTAPTASQSLYDGTATGLQLNVSDGTTTYLSGVQYNNQAGTATTLTPSSGTASIANLLVNTAVVTSATAAKTFTVNYTLPTTAGNAYNLATSTVVLRIHAVQADNNALPGGCALGNVCTTSMTWS